MPAGPGDGCDGRFAAVATIGVRENVRSLVGAASTLDAVRRPVARASGQLFLRSSRRMPSSASMISSREARLLANESFRLNALVDGLKAKT